MASMHRVERVLAQGALAVKAARRWIARYSAPAAVARVRARVDTAAVAAGAGGWRTVLIDGTGNQARSTQARFTIRALVIATAFRATGPVAAERLPLWAGATRPATAVVATDLVGTVRAATASLALFLLGLCIVSADPGERRQDASQAGNRSPPRRVGNQCAHKAVKTLTLHEELLPKIFDHGLFNCTGTPRGICRPAAPSDDAMAEADRARALTAIGGLVTDGHVARGLAASAISPGAATLPGTAGVRRLGRGRRAGLADTQADGTGAAGASTVTTANEAGMARRTVGTGAVHTDRGGIAAGGGATGAGSIRLPTCPGSPQAWPCCSASTAQAPGVFGPAS